MVSLQFSGKVFFFCLSGSKNILIAVYFHQSKLASIAVPSVLQGMSKLWVNINFSNKFNICYSLCIHYHDLKQREMQIKLV